MFDLRDGYIDFEFKIILYINFIKIFFLEYFGLVFEEFLSCIG